jgi:hypothetical protein
MMGSVGTVMILNVSVERWRQIASRHYSYYILGRDNNEIYRGYI